MLAKTRDIISPTNEKDKQILFMLNACLRKQDLIPDSVYKKVEAKIAQRRSDTLTSMK